VPGGGARVLVLKVEFPDWSGRKAGRISTGLAGETARSSHVLPAAIYTTIEVPLPASAGMQLVELQGEDDFPLPAPDTRRRTGRLVSAEIRAGK
jgi:hypothetical protein